MKTLILYATKHGATRDIAQRLAKRMDGATTIDLGTGSAPAPGGYDCVIIGSSVYAGMLRKEAKEYASKHADALKAVKLGLFISGMAPEGAQSYAESNYPKDVATHAKVVQMLGGTFDPAKSGLFDKLVMRMILKSSAYKSTIENDKIDQFAEAMRQ